MEDCDPTFYICRHLEQCITNQQIQFRQLRIIMEWILTTFELKFPQYNAIDEEEIKMSDISNSDRKTPRSTPESREQKSYHGLKLHIRIGSQTTSKRDQSVERASSVNKKRSKLAKGISLNEVGLTINE